MDSISFRNVLPQVFREVSDSTAITDSQVWLADFSLKRPGQYIIEAASGTGKSSLCSFMYGNRHDYDGHILFNQTDIRSFSMEDWCRIRRSHLALLPQEMRLFPELTAGENILLKNRLTDFMTEERIHRLLEVFELDHKYNVPAGRLSIGQQQRVALIRTLCQPFDFILLDEPVSHLDAANNALAAQMILHEAAAQQAGIIVTSVGNPLLITDYTPVTL
ncbi:MAG: ATP-binding cassette domain-containing protein [Muribaculaceae bacterium]|nr:ATP-binding cassette domain-containing protein [Muribaculaceae bacterium]